MGRDGFTLVEIMIGMAIMGIVALGLASVVTTAESNGMVLNARSDANAQLGQLFTLTGKAFRTRITKRPDNGFAIGNCGDPPPRAVCLDMFRRRIEGGHEIVVKTRIKNVCVALKPGEKALLKRLDVTEAQIGGAVSGMCGFVCPNGQKPLVVVRESGSTRGKVDLVLPKGRGITPSAAFASGFCAQMRGKDEALFTFGMTYMRHGDGPGAVELARRELVAPTIEDKSKVEFVP